MQSTIQISTSTHNGLYDITRQVEAIVAKSGVKTGLVNVYAQGATSAIMILFFYIYPVLSFYVVLCFLFGSIVNYSYVCSIETR